MVPVATRLVIKGLTLYATHVCIPDGLQGKKTISQPSWMAYLITNYVSLAGYMKNESFPTLLDGVPFSEARSDSYIGRKGAPPFQQARSDCHLSGLSSTLNQETLTITSPASPSGTFLEK